MYKELTSDIEGFARPDHGYLEGWAKQGIISNSTIVSNNNNYYCLV